MTAALTIARLDIDTRREVTVADLDRFTVIDEQGTRWRVTPNRYGPGLTVTLAETADGDTAMSVQPEGSNSITVAPRIGR